LRVFTEDDLLFLDRLCTDPDVLGEFEWPGFRSFLRGRYVGVLVYGLLREDRRPAT
jgi:hypothetical protein